MTSECIDSIFRQKCPLQYEIILVDNASTDESKEHFSKDNRIQYIYSHENLGFGKANNLGYKKAAGKYILLLNSDTILKNDAISLFFKQAELSNSNVACWGTTLIDKNGNIIHSYGKFPTFSDYILKIINNYTRIFGWRVLKKKNAATICTNGQFVDYITGADLFLRRSIIDKFGLFNTSFFMYYEETEMQYRYAQHNYKAMIINGPQIIHIIGGSQKKSLKRWRIEFISSQIYAKLCFNITKYFMVRFCSLFYIPKILLFPASFKEKIITIKSIFTPNNKYC